MIDDLTIRLRDEIEALKVSQAVMMGKQETNCTMLKDIHALLIGDGLEKAGIIVRLDRIERTAAFIKWMGGALAALLEEHIRHFWINGK